MSDPVVTTVASEFVFIMSHYLSPLLDITVNVMRLVGILFVINGLTRLHRHANKSMMHRVSPMGTVFYFIVGAMLTSYSPILYSLANGVFSQKNTSFYHSCTATVAGSTGAVAVGAIGTRSNCPIMGYVASIENIEQTDQAKSGYTKDLIKEMSFALLFLVGVIAFFRGIMLLVKLGDGRGDGSLMRSITHILAGIFGVNAEAAYNLFSNMLHLQGLTH